jgi:hypothetical protein
MSVICFICKVYDTEICVTNSGRHDMDLYTRMESKRAPTSTQCVEKLWQMDVSSNWDGVRNMTAHIGVHLRSNGYVVHQRQSADWNLYNAFMLPWTSGATLWNTWSWTRLPTLLQEVTVGSLKYSGSPAARYNFIGVRKIAEVTISFVMSVCPSVCLYVRMEQFGSHSTDFGKILYLNFLRNI